MNFDELEDWIITEKGINIRLVRGGNINNPKHIVAIIDNHPRVRINRRLCEVDITNTMNTVIDDNIFGNREPMKSDVWIKGTLKTTLHRKNYYARRWCDNLLSLLGFR